MTYFLVCFLHLTWGNFKLDRGGQFDTCKGGALPRHHHNVTATLDNVLFWEAAFSFTQPALPGVPQPHCDFATRKAESTRLIAVMENREKRDSRYDFKGSQKCTTWASRGVISRSVRVLVNDHHTDNIWQPASISSLPKPNNTSPPISELYFS